jgi:hypothetical protein
MLGVQPATSPSAPSPVPAPASPSGGPKGPRKTSTPSEKTEAAKLALASSDKYTMMPGSQYAIEGNWKQEFARFIGRLGGLATSWRRMPIDVQNQAAHIIAELYRMFIREGIEPENSALTQVLTGIHPPLSGLADYIIVVESGDSRATGAYPGRPKPALVTWHPDWTVIAFLHDRGYAFVPSPQQREALFKRAEGIAGSTDHFLEEGFSTQGIWEVPARPHAWYIRSPEMDRLLEVVAMAHLAGKPFNVKSTRPPNVPWSPGQSKKGKTGRLDDIRQI